MSTPSNPAATPRTVRLHGAASVADTLVKPYAGAVQARTGLTLAIDRSNAGKGLKDLVEGRCELAMVSASLEAIVAAARSAGLEGDLPELRMHLVSTSEVVFVVHPSNAVKALSWEQLRDVHTGAVLRWSELGGDGASIDVVTDAAASATRALVKQVVLGGAEYGPGVRALAAVRDVNDAVAAAPAAIGALGLEFVDPARVSVVRTAKIERPLALVTRGEPERDAAAVIAAYRAEVSGP